MSLSAEDLNKIINFLSNKSLKNKTKVASGFTNYMHTQQKAGSLVIDVDNKEALSALLLEVQALNKNKQPEDRIILRAASGGRTNVPHSACYSATLVTNADIVVRLTGREFTRLTCQANSNIVRAGASMQIGELDKELYNHHELSLPTASLIPYVTVAGLAAPGGHGTGKDQPSFAGLIRGATFMLENGREVHISNDHPDFATIMGANNGLFGIITDVDIECTPRKKMECVMEKRSVAEFMREVERGLFQHDPYVSAMYMPTYLPDEMTNPKIKNVIVYRWRPVPLETNDKNHTPHLSDITQALQTDIGEAVNIGDILRQYPSITPFYMRHITTRFGIGDDDEIAVGPWHSMMHYRTSFPTDLTEICGIFPVKDQPEKVMQGAEIVKALKHTINLLSEYAERGEYPVTYGLYFRFLQGTNGGLSFTSYPKDHHVCAMDITTNKNVPGYARFEKQMQDYFLNEMNAKFHWGKNAPLDLDYQKMYGDEWTALKKALENWHRTYHTSLPYSSLLNPLFSTVLGYPVPHLAEAEFATARVIPLALKQQTANNAQNLMCVMGDNSAMCEHIQKQIDADLRKKTSSCTLFARKPVTPEIARLPEEKKSIAVNHL